MNASLQGKYFIKTRFWIFVILIKTEILFLIFMCLERFKSACDLKSNVAVVSKCKFSVYIWSPPVIRV